MKKVLALTAALLIMAAVAGCSSKGAAPENGNGEVPVSSTMPVPGHEGVPEHIVEPDGSGTNSGN